MGHESVTENRRVDVTSVLILRTDTVKVCNLSHCETHSGYTVVPLHAKQIQVSG